MKPLSIDLRYRIVCAYETGNNTKLQIADRFSVSVTVVKKLISQWKNLGAIEPQYQTVGRKPAFNKALLKELDELVQRRCDITLVEIQEHFKDKGHSSTSVLSQCFHIFISSRLKKSLYTEIKLFQASKEQFSVDSVRLAYIMRHRQCT